MKATRSKRTDAKSLSTTADHANQRITQTIRALSSRVMQTTEAAKRLDAMSKSGGRVLDMARRLSAALDRLAITYTRKPHIEAGAVNSIAGRQTARRDDDKYNVRDRPEAFVGNALTALKHAFSEDVLASWLALATHLRDPARAERRINSTVAPISLPGQSRHRTRSDGSSSIDRMRAATRASRQLTRGISNTLALTDRSRRNANPRSANLLSRHDGADAVRAPGRLNDLPRIRSRIAGEAIWAGAIRPARIAPLSPNLRRRDPIRSSAARSSARGTSFGPIFHRPARLLRHTAFDTFGGLTVPTASNARIRPLGLRASKLTASLALQSDSSTRASRRWPGVPTLAPGAKALVDGRIRPIANVTTAGGFSRLTAAAPAPKEFRGASAPPRQQITLNYSPTVIVRDSDGSADLDRRVADALRRHGPELLHVLSRELRRRNRTQF